MSEVRGHLDEARKVPESGSDSELQGRHSEPKDSTPGPESLDPVAKSSDPLPGVEGSEESTLMGKPVHVGVEDPNLITVLRYAPPSRDGQQRTRVLSFAGVGAHPYSTSSKLPPAEGLTKREGRQREKVSGGNVDPGEEIHHWQYPNYLTRHTTGRNAQFFGLSRAEREHLGGVE